MGRRLGGLCRCSSCSNSDRRAVTAAEQGGVYCCNAPGSGRAIARADGDSRALALVVCALRVLVSRLTMLRAPKAEYAGDWLTS